MKRKWWRLWCRTLGEKVSSCDKESDVACAFRTVYAVIMFVTCFFIIANTVVHWPS